MSFSSLVESAEQDRKSWCVVWSVGWGHCCSPWPGLELVRETAAAGQRPGQQERGDVRTRAASRVAGVGHSGGHGQHHQWGLEPAGRAGGGGGPVIRHDHLLSEGRRLVHRWRLHQTPLQMEGGFLPFPTVSKTIQKLQNVKRAWKLRPDWVVVVVLGVLS